MGCRGYIVQGLYLYRYSILPPLARLRLECNLPNIIYCCIYTFAALCVVSVAPALLLLHSVRCALFTVCSWLLVIPTHFYLELGSEGRQLAAPGKHPARNQGFAKRISLLRRQPWIVSAAARPLPSTKNCQARTPKFSSWPPSGLATLEKSAVAGWLFAVVLLPLAAF